MPPAVRTALALACTAGLALGTAAPALAHDGRTKVAAALGAPIPSVTSDNVKHIAGIPETTAISMEFARTGPFAYVSSLDTISVLDLTDPRDPQLRGTLVQALFENESMTYGERVIDGKLVRFVIAGIDLYRVATDDPEHINVDSGAQLAIIDVTDPDKPFTRSVTPLDGPAAITSSTHTVQCVDQKDCRYAYTAGGRAGFFSILDFSNLDAPKQVKTVFSPAAGPGDAKEGQGFSTGAGHYWDFDGLVGWHTGSGGAAAFNVKDPLNPQLLNATNGFGRGAPINDFILHNSMRPNAAAFKPGAPPSIKNGNVLLVTEEDYADQNDGSELACADTGSFQTWYIPDLNGPAYRAKNPDGKTPDLGTIAPLDQVIAPVDFGGGLSGPVAPGFCSAHWFDVHQDGYVALGHYGAGMRILDVNDPKGIKQLGYATGGATQVWDAYWVPERDAAGVVVPGRKTNLVYTADAVRGIEVFEVTLPSSVAPPAAPPQAPPPNEPPPNTPPASSPGTGGTLASTGVETWLPLAALTLMAGALAARRRRTS